MNRNRREVLIELLVIQWQSGDPKAIGRLADHFQPELVAFAYRLTGDYHAARDVVQEAWLSAVKTIGRLNDPATFRAWIFRIVHNKSMDSLRAVVRDRNALESLWRSSLANSNQDASEEAGDLAEIRELIDALEPADRALIILYYENELSVREIAAITGNTESASKSKLYHIRQKFKTSLSKSEGTDRVRKEQN